MINTAFEQGHFLLEPLAAAKLHSYNVAYPRHALADSCAKAVEIAEQIGYPVVLKVVSPQVVHKSDAGGVRVNLTGPTSVKEAYSDILKQVKTQRPRATIAGVLVCRQAPEGLEVIVGGIKDPVFGPTIMFGLGGIYTEVFNDVVFRVAPLRPIDAEEMLGEIKGHALLTGTRGRDPVDIAALQTLLLSISRLMIAEPQIAELDLNPVRLYQQKLMALDVRIRMEG